MDDGSKIPESAKGHVLSPRILRAAKLLQTVGLVGVTGYLVFFYDFGEQEHCFSPIRRFARAKYNLFLTPTQEESLEIEQLKLQQRSYNSNSSNSSNNS